MFDLRFTCCTYNIHRCVGTDAVRNIDRVVAVLEEIQPDILALQEVDAFGPNWLETSVLGVIRHRLNLQYVIYHPTMLTEDESYGIALLSRFPITTERTVALTNAGREPRLMTEAFLTYEDLTLQVIHTHLGLKRSERLDQTNRILNSMVGPEGSDATILLGDLNEWWERSRMQRNLRDVFRGGQQHRTFPAKRPILSLDRIWYRGVGFSIDVAVHDSDLARVASDHRPLVGCARFYANPKETVPVDTTSEELRS